MYKIKLKRLASITLIVAVLLTATVFAISTSAENAAVPTEKWTDHAATAFDSGTGTETDPYLIANEAQLAYLCKWITASNKGDGKYFKVTAKTLDMGDYLWVPINQFRGVFDGNNCVIENVVIKNAVENKAGLFECIRGAAVVKDLTLRVSIDIDTARIGGLTGAAYDQAKVSNVTIYADIKSDNELEDSMIGGAVGYFTGDTSSMENVTVYGNIQVNTAVNTWVAGVVGRVTRTSANPLTLKNLVNYANVTLTSAIKRTYLGGIAAVVYVDDVGNGTTINFLQCANFGTLTTIASGSEFRSRIGGILAASGGGDHKNEVSVVLEACLNAGALVSNCGNLTPDIQNGSMIAFDLDNNVNTKLSLKGCLSTDKAPLIGNTDNFHKPEVKGSVCGISLTTLDGARVRMDTDGNTSGIRFDSVISKAAIDTLKQSEGVTFQVGTLIAPTANLVAVDGTYDLISALSAKENNTHVKVQYPNDSLVADDEAYEFSGAIGEMNAENFDLAFSAVAYLTVTTANGSVTLYADNGVANGVMATERTRTVKQIATMALADTTASYTDAQKAILEHFSTYTANNGAN